MTRRRCVIEAQAGRRRTKKIRCVHADQIEAPSGRRRQLHLIVEIKGYRREDAKIKKSTMETYWVPGVNNLGTHGRWAFAEFTDIYQIEADFKDKVETEFDKMIEAVIGEPVTEEA